MRRWVVLGLLAAGESWMVPAARAQDDWSITREAPRSSRAPVRAKGRALSPPSDLRTRYLEALQRQPDDAFALERLHALCLAQDGSLEKLYSQLAAARDARPNDPKLRELLARLAALSGQSDEAERHVNEALALAPSSERLLQLRAELRLARGERALAREDYQALLRTRGGTRRAVALRALGELALDEGDVAAARRFFDELGRSAPGDTAARTAMAQALAQRGAHADAARVYLDVARSMRGDPRASAPLFRDAAAAQLAAGDIEGALSTLSRARPLASASLRSELYALEVDAYRRADRLSELAERTEREGRSGDPSGLPRAAALWAELGDDSRARAALRWHLDRAPRDVDAREHLVRVLARLGLQEELLEAYRQLVQHAPDEPRYVTAWAELLREAGEPQKALSVLQAASRRAPAAVALHKALAELYARWSEHELAAAELKILARLEPDEPAHLIALGEEAFVRGDREAAHATWQRLLERAGERAEAHAALARVLGDHDMLDAAIAHAESAWKLEPDNLEHQRMRASLLERAGRMSEAEAAWQRVLAAVAHDVIARREARQHIVGIWRRQGVTARRTAELESRVHGEPPDLEAMRMLAELYARDPSRAERELTMLRRIAALAPDDVDTLRSLERAYLGRGQAAEALAVLERLVKAEPAQAAAHLSRAVDLALESYQDDAALAYAQRALALRPDDAKVQRLVGDLFRRRQELDEAVAAYTRAAGTDPRDFDSRVVLAQLESARGRAQEAIRWWCSVLAGSSDDLLVTRAGRAARELAANSELRDGFEDTLLELALSRPARAVYRRLLVETYGAWLRPAVARSSEGSATPDDRAALERAARRAAKPLVEALTDSDPVQRATAIELLAALRTKNAGASLLGLAERGSVAAERARALVAVGQLGDPSLAPRLRALFASSERRLAPFALWALVACEGSRASDAVLGALEASDTGVRTVAVLLAGALRIADAEPHLWRVLEERHGSLRSAAAWALARVADVEAPAGFRQFLEQLSEAASLLGLAAFHEDADLVARALLSPSPALRDAAALLMRSAPRPLHPTMLPAPRWPFSLQEYVATWGRALLRESGADGVRLSTRWPTVMRVFLSALTEAPERAASVLSQLAPHDGGLVPRALLDRDPCVSLELARELAYALREPLVALAKRPSTRQQAVLLLIQTGAAEHEQVLAAFERPDAPGIGELLDALDAAGPLGEPLRARLLHVFDRAHSWPVRLRVARLLGPALGASRLREEPVALVRAATETKPARRDAAPCSSERAPN